MTETLDPKRRLDLLRDGARARAAGRPKDACPHPLDAPERAAWMEGFDGEPAEQGPDLPMDQS